MVALGKSVIMIKMCFKNNLAPSERRVREYEEKKNNLCALLKITLSLYFSVKTCIVTSYCSVSNHQ